MAPQKRDHSGAILGDRYQIEQQISKKAGRRTLLAQDLHTQSLVIIKLLTFRACFKTLLGVLCETSRSLINEGIA